MPLHVMIWPRSARQQTLRELYAFNLDERLLRERFIAPYEHGEPITWDGRTLDGGDVEYLRIRETPAALDEDAIRAAYAEHDSFKRGRDVTNEWITGPAGSAAIVKVASQHQALPTVLTLCRRFDAVARQLCRRYSNRATLEITDEFDVQNLMHALLLVHFDDVRAESWNPTYLGGASRVDFLIPDAGIVVEVKKTRLTLRDKQVGGELAEDVTRYSDPAANHRATTLVCFVHDPDRLLVNPVGLEHDLAAASNERLRVVGVVG